MFAFFNEGHLGFRTFTWDFSNEGGCMEEVFERCETGSTSIRQRGSWKEAQPFFLISPLLFEGALRPLHV